MRVTMTGASGNIGSRTCVALLEAGHEVVATDRKETNPVPVELHVADLLDRDATAGLFDGSDAVIHLGNHPSFHPPDTQMIFNENVTMNMNVFAAAIDAGVRRIIFASSIQAMIGVLHPSPEPGVYNRLPYLPLDSDVPAGGPNPYGLSKQVGEVMLDYLTRRYGDLSAVALRFPATRVEAETHVREPEAFTHLTCGDAVRLMCAILASDLPGFRAYFPATTILPDGMSARDAIRAFYGDIDLRRPLEEIDGLVDVSRITAETGWTVEDYVIP